MGYNDDMLPDISPIMVDIETCGLPNAADFLEPVQASKNLVDPAKITADIEKRTQERDEKLALDWNVGRIVAIGWWTATAGVGTALCLNEADEARALRAFWESSKRRTIIGFNVKGFDLKFMIQRSRYLGLDYPLLDLGKYTRKGIVDLFSELTFNDGTYDQGAMRRTLKAFCKRFGIPVDDTVNGADVPTLVAAGEWDKVKAHVTSDIDLTLALAQRLGVVRIADPVEVA